MHNTGASYNGLMRNNLNEFFDDESTKSATV